MLRQVFENLVVLRTIRALLGNMKISSPIRRSEHGAGKRVLACALILLAAHSFVPRLDSRSQAFVQNSPQTDPAVQEVVMACKKLDHGLMNDAYNSTLRLVSSVAHSGNLRRVEHGAWKNKMIQAILNMESAGLSRALGKNLVHLTTDYQFTQVPDQLRSDCLRAGMPREVLDKLSRGSKSERIETAKAIATKGYSAYLLAVVSQIDDLDIVDQAGTGALAHGRTVLVSAGARTGVLQCVFSIFGLLVVAVGIAGCATAITGITLISCLLAIASLPGATLGVLIDCFPNSTENNPVLPSPNR